MSVKCKLMGHKWQPTEVTYLYFRSTIHFDSLEIKADLPKGLGKPQMIKLTVETDRLICKRCKKVFGK